MKHYLFIGGPWDGQWMEAPRCPHINLTERPSVNFATSLMAEEKMDKGMEIHTYTLRSIWIGASHIEVYTEMGIPDCQLLTNLLSVYTRT